MTASTMTLSRQTNCFQLKTSFLPCTIMQLTRYDLDAFEQQLKAAIKQAPIFFAGSPVVLDLEKVQSLGTLDFAKIKDILFSNGLVPIGVRSGSQEQINAASNMGLPLLNLGRTTFAENKKKTDQPVTTAKLITTPIRSGMQVYAKESDLIIMTPQVSPGAELLADGNIHVYGALRGRAMAGVRGNTEARIFCRTLEAELVSIAGYYLTKEDMQKLPTESVQVYLDGEQVKIESI